MTVANTPPGREVRRAVVVEDDPAWARLTREAFRDAAPDVDLALFLDGATALAHLRQRHDVDLLILDLDLPGADGHEIVAALEGDPRAPRVVVVTASASPQDLRRVLDGGAAAVHPKPANYRGLVGLVREIVGAARPAEPSDGAVPARPGAAADPPGVVRVVAVDDRALAAGLTSARLGGLGFALRRAVSLGEFLGGTGPEWADCLLLDLSAPDAWGLDGLRAVRTRAPGLAIVVVADQSDDGFALLALAAGAQDYLDRDDASGALLARTIRHAVERKAFEAALAFRALHDPLTGLPSRALFERHLAGALARSARPGLTTAVLVVDLDHFESVNDAYDRGVGDEVLVEVANRLTAGVRPSDTVARLGDDEFAVCCEGLADGGGAEALAARLIEAIGHPIVLGRAGAGPGALVAPQVTASVGVAVAAPGADSVALMRQADQACRTAQARGRATFVRREDVAAPLPGMELLQALFRDDVVVACEPLARADGALAAVSVHPQLVHHTRGSVGAELLTGADTLPEVARALDQQVVAHALRNLAEWRARPEALDLAAVLRLTAAGMHDAESAVWMAEMADRHGVEPSALWVEIDTPSLTRPAVAGAAAALRARGIRVLAAGFEPLALPRLGRLALDGLRPGRSFTDAMADGAAGQAILAALANLCEALGLTTVVGGISDQRSLDIVRRAGIRWMHGPHVAPPGAFERSPDELIGRSTVSGTAWAPGEGPPAIVTRFPAG